MTVEDPQTLTNGPSLHCRARFSCSIPQLDTILNFFLDTYLRAGRALSYRCLEFVSTPLSINLFGPLPQQTTDQCFHYHGDTTHHCRLSI